MGYSGSRGNNLGVYGDGTYLIYVNGAYNGDDQIGIVNAKYEVNVLWATVIAKD